MIAVSKFLFPCEGGNTSEAERDGVAVLDVDAERVGVGEWERVGSFVVLMCFLDLLLVPVAVSDTVTSIDRVTDPLCSVFDAVAEGCDFVSDDVDELRWRVRDTDRAVLHEDDGVPALGVLVRLLRRNVAVIEGDVVLVGVLVAAVAVTVAVMVNFDTVSGFVRVTAVVRERLCIAVAVSTRMGEAFTSIQ
jgi:hypothetical protein